MKTLTDLLDYVKSHNEYPSNFKQLIEDNQWEDMYSHQTTEIVKDREGFTINESEGRYYILPPSVQEKHLTQTSAIRAAREYCNKYKCDIRDSKVEEVMMSDIKTYSSAGDGKDGFDCHGCLHVILIRKEVFGEYEVVARFAFQKDE